MNVGKYFWNYNQKAARKARETLKNRYHPEFIRNMYAILSMTQDAKEVFSIVDKAVFVEKWPEIRRYWARRKQALDYKAWWETIFEHMAYSNRENRKHGEPSVLFRKIGLIIREKRIEMDLSQKDFALRAGLSQPNITAIEMGKVNLTLETLEKIGKILGIKEIPLSAKQEK